jgi:hypothetical protein
MKLIAGVRRTTASTRRRARLLANLVAQASVARPARVTRSVGRTKMSGTTMNAAGDLAVDLDYRCSPWSRFGVPLMVGIISAAAIMWAISARPFGLAGIMISFAVGVPTAIEVSRRSSVVRLTGRCVHEGTGGCGRRLPLEQLRQLRVYRGQGVWLVFGQGVHPVGIIRPMGQPEEVVKTILARAHQAGAAPEVMNARGVPPTRW